MAVIVFDIGGVLAPEGDRIRRLTTYLADRHVSVETQRLSDAYWRHRDSYDLGQSDQKYWTTVLNDAGVESQRLSHVDFQQLGALDGNRNAHLSTDTAALVNWLERHRAHLALLSNAPLSMVTAVRESEWGALFPVKVFSSEVGLAKPDVRIYHVAQERIVHQFGSDQASQVHFFDDRPINLEPATHAHWTPHLFQSVAGCQAILAELFNTSA